MAPCHFFPWKPVAAVENPMASCKRRSQLSAASGVLLALANLAISKIRGELLWYVCMAGRCCFLNRHCAAIINYFSFIMCCQQHGFVCANSVSKAGLLAMIKCSIYTLQTNQTDLLWRLKRLSLWLLLPKKNRCCSASRLWAQALVPNFVETWQIEDGEANLAIEKGITMRMWMAWSTLSGLKGYKMLLWWTGEDQLPCHKSRELLKIVTQAKVEVN